MLRDDSALLLHRSFDENGVKELSFSVEPTTSDRRRLCPFPPSPTSPNCNTLRMTIHHHNNTIKRQQRRQKPASIPRESSDIKNVKNKKELGLWASSPSPSATEIARHWWNRPFTDLIRPAEGPSSCLLVRTRDRGYVHSTSGIEFPGWPTMLKRD
jgi:hypothetical protein